VTSALKARKKEREDVGVDLYGLQQELARYQALLEKYHDEYSAVQAERLTTERELEEERKDHTDKLNELNSERKKGAELQTEVLP